MFGVVGGRAPLARRTGKRDAHDKEAGRLLFVASTHRHLGQPSQRVGSGSLDALLAAHLEAFPEVRRRQARVARAQRSTPERIQLIGQ